MKTILIVDDDSSLSIGLKRLLDNCNYKIITCEGVEEAKKIESDFKIDLAIVDLNLNDGVGTDLIADLKKTQPYMQSLLITGEHSINITIVSAINQGVDYFIPKPFDSNTLLNLVKKALKQKDILDQNKNLKANIKKQFDFKKIVGQSSVILKLTEDMHKVAKKSSPILIIGESGTGKELVARSIHCSQDSSRPFISVNCGAIPKELLESEFFGHVKGAFTGATSNRKGYFQVAQEGTLFLDEIGTMELNLQVKLLRVLQEKTFTPVGSTNSFVTNARIISATNIDLEKAVEKGLFRKDLYYRLNIIPLKIAPLRERKDDIPLLIEHFLKKHSQDVLSVSDKVLINLCNYHWPGNIRELENLIERLCVFKESGIIEECDLPDKYRTSKASVKPLSSLEIPKEGLDFNSSVDAYENLILMEALKKTKWNKSQAASLLNLNRTTLLEKIKKKGLQLKQNL
ncbi:MAG: sigma-54-dependent Fis family transcriptional regulator [Bdellovibrionales bacterium]|nr:sigma-54-dependent Fis family transcriptional regulator [Bdellovibrionales bacterium]